MEHLLVGCAALGAHMMLSFSFQLLNHFFFIKKGGKKGKKGKKMGKTRKKKGFRYIKYFPNLTFTCKQLLYLQKDVIWSPREREEGAWLWLEGRCP